MRDMTPKEMAVNELARLLAPVLTHHHGMAAQDREDRFRAALETLVGPTGPRPTDTEDAGHE
jgi:hypothetical protein